MVRPSYSGIEPEALTQFSGFDPILELNLNLLYKLHFFSKTTCGCLICSSPCMSSFYLSLFSCVLTGCDLIRRGATHF